MNGHSMGANGLHRRGLTLVELLVALAISLVFMGSVVTAYVQISRSADMAEAEVKAHVRARNAADTIARDIRRVRTDPALADQVFLLESQTLTFGDKIDNDGDGAVDEEEFDGLDDDGDWQATDDNHAEIATGMFERPDFVGVPDHGDFKVEEDFLFSRDQLTIRIPADPLVIGSAAQQITYRVDSFEGMDNVLVREVTTGSTSVIEPLVFEVVSLDFLAWNANNDVATSPGMVQRPYWQAEYDAMQVQFPDQAPVGAPFGTPPFEFPAAVLIAVTVNAEAQSLEDVTGWPLGNETLKTTTLTTVVAIDEVIKNPAYRAFIRPRI